MATQNKQPKLAILPTMLTLGNGVCGLGAIAAATSATAAEGNLQAVLMAGVLIYLGMLFDALDGHVARLTHQTSRFGAELDSLCDAITFGVAPVFILLSISDGFPRRLLWGIGVLFMLCSLLRLARFNSDKSSEPQSTDWFRGLPTPAAAGTLASFAIAMPELKRLADAVPEGSRIVGQLIIHLTQLGLPLLTILLASLMVSRIRYPHLLNRWSRGHRNFFSLVQFLFVAVAVVTVHELALPIVFCFYALERPIVVWMRFIGPRIRRLSTPHTPHERV